MPLDMIRRQLLAGAVASPALVGQMASGREPDRAEGDPVGSIMAGGLFAQLGGLTIPAAANLIQTTGHTVLARGIATYARTTTTGATAWRKQSADGAWWELANEIPNLWDFGWSETDNDATILAAMAWAGTTGRTLIVPAATFKYVTQLPIPANLILQGVGWEAVLDGPGLKGSTPNVDGAGFALYGDRVITVRDLTMDGRNFPAALGIDFFALNFAHVEHVRFQGFKHQLVADVVQRFTAWRNKFEATAATISGILIPRGPEIHPTTSFSLHPTNIVEIKGNHFSFGAADQNNSWGIIDHGGRQHLIQGNQSSYGRAHMRLGGNIGDLTVANNDWEFSSTWAAETVTTNLLGQAFTDRVDTMTIQSGNYIDKPFFLPRVTFLNLIGNAFFIPERAAIQGVASMRSVRSFGNKNNRPGGTILDALPAGSSTATLVQFDEENQLPVCRANNMKFSADFSISDVFNLSGAPVATAFRNDKGFGRLDAYHAATNTGSWSARYGYFQPGTDVGKGARIYSGVGDPNKTPPGGAPQGESIYIQLLAPTANYRSEYLLWYKNGAATTWVQMFKPRVLNVAQAGGATPAVPPNANGEHVTISDSASNRVPAWGKGGIWRWADGTIVG